MSQIYKNSSGGGGAITTVDVDNGGSVTGSTIQLYANSGSANAGTTVNFIAISATEIDLQMTNGGQNTLIGFGAGYGNSLGTGNTGLGSGVLGGVNAGSWNTSVGYGSGNGVVTESYNSFFGYLAGASYFEGESSNICIGNEGVAAESNVIRIGNQGNSSNQQDECFIAGIVGVTVSNAVPVMIDSSTGQLGVGSGSGITTINVDNSGSVTGSTIDLYALDGGANAGATLAFVASSSTEIDLQTTDANGNIAIGNNAFIDNGTAASTYSTVVGQSAAYYGDIWNFTCAFGFQAGVCSGTSGTNTINNSCFFGADCGSGAIASTTDDSFFGYDIGPNYVGGSGQNTILGSQSIGSLASGTLNISIGYMSGSAWNGAESGNINIGSNGVSGDDNITRIGYLGGSPSQAQCYIDGINGNTVSNAVPVMIDSSTGQLGVGTSSTPIRFLSYLSSGGGSAGGDGSYQTLVCNSTDINDSSIYDTSTGIVTVNATGMWFFSFNLGMGNVLSNNTDLLCYFNTGSGKEIVCSWNVTNGAIANTGSDAGLQMISATALLYVESGDTVHVEWSYGGNVSKNINLNTSSRNTSFGGYFVG